MRLVHLIASVAERPQDEGIVRYTQMDAADAKTVRHPVDGEAILQRRRQKACFRRARSRIMGMQDAQQAKLDGVVRQHRTGRELIGGRRASHALFSG